MRYIIFNNKSRQLTDKKIFNKSNKKILIILYKKMKNFFLNLITSFLLIKAGVIALNNPDGCSGDRNESPVLDLPSEHLQTVENG